MLIDQASQLRSLVQGVRAAAAGNAPAATEARDTAGSVAPVPARRRATVIAVTSGKGGVGKSNVAVNLAIQLTASGKRVVLLDADLGLANADVLCNVELPANLSHVIARKKELREVMFDAPGGFRLIGGASGLARMADLSDADRQRLVVALAELEESADVILIDTGAGISPNVLTFTRAADHVLVVTTPEPTAITDAYAVIKVVSRRDAGTPAAGGERRVSLLVNEARTPGEARVVFDRIAKVARQFLSVTVQDAGHVPLDEQVQTAVRKRVPFVLASPRCPASQSIAQLASRLQQGVALTTATDEEAETNGFFNRIARWFKR